MFDIAQANVQDVMDDARVAPIKRRIWTCVFQVGGGRGLTAPCTVSGVTADWGERTQRSNKN